MARPQFQATEKQRRQVRNMVALEESQEKIAAVLKITAKTLRKHFRDELDCWVQEANSEVMDSLYQMAKSGKNASATIFWVKALCGLKEKTRPEDKPAQEVPQLIVKLD